jgi:chemotaxis protein MotA
MVMLNLIGIIFAVVVLITSFVWGNDDPGALVDLHGVLIVIGGTVAAVGVSFRIDRAAKMIKIFFQGMFKTRITEPEKLIEEMMALGEAYKANSPQLESMIEEIEDPFLKDAMVTLTDGVFSQKKLYKVNLTRAQTVYQRYMDEARMFTACGKFPPAMGLMGAVLGMIALLATLGKPGAEKNIGPAMSVALVATLYGIALANLFIIPIGQNLEEIARAMKTKNLIICEGVRIIGTKVNAIELAEELNAYLLPSERVDWKSKAAG